MATNASNLTLPAPLKRSHSDLQITWPAGDDFYFEPDQPVETNWTLEIEGDSYGSLYIFEMGDTEPYAVVADLLTGSSYNWSLPSTLVDTYFFDGGVYWLGLEVLPESARAESDPITLRVLSDDMVSSSTTSMSLPTPVSTSLGQENIASVSVLTKTQTVYPSSTSVDSSQSSEWNYEEPPSPDTKTLSPVAKVGIAIGGGLLGTVLLLLVGFFIYRRRRSSTKYREPGGDHDTAVEELPEELPQELPEELPQELPEELPEQQAGSDTPEKRDTSGKVHIAGYTAAYGKPVANGTLHEME